MPESPKHLRAALKPTLSAELLSVGYTPLKGVAYAYTSENACALPLQATLLSDVQVYKFGGIRVGFYLDVQSPLIDQIVSTLSSDSLSPRIARRYTYNLRYLQLDHVSFGTLTEHSTNEKFVYVTESQQVPSAVSEIVEAVRGPGAGWFQDRATASLVLDGAINDAQRVTDLTIRSLVLLACEQNSFDLAQALLAGYSPMGGDTAERIDAFGAFVAERYGQRLDPQVNR